MSMAVNLQAGAGRAGGEVFEREAVCPPSRVRSWPARPGRSRAWSSSLDCGSNPYQAIDRAVGRAGLDLVGVDPLAGHQLVGLAVAVDVGPEQACGPRRSTCRSACLVQVRSPPELLACWSQKRP